MKKNAAKVKTAVSTNDAADRVLQSLKEQLRSDEKVVYRQYRRDNYVIGGLRLY